MILRDKICLTVAIVGIALICVSILFAADISVGVWGALAGVVTLVAAPLVHIWWPTRQAKGE